jgi:hypothetical protein
VCPFCTDQQHKYPRPDNLQRYYFPLHLYFICSLTSPDMSKRTTSTEARTTRSCAMCLRSGPRAAGAAVDGGGIRDRHCVSSLLNTPFPPSMKNG